MELITIIAILGALVLIGSGGTLAAFSLSGSTDVIVTATIKNHPDTGHGTPSLWADDSFTRTMLIHKTGVNAYTITTTDKGTFTTRMGAGSPSGAGKAIERKLTGAFKSAGTGHVTGTLIANPGTLSGKSYDDLHGTPFPGSGAWANIFFGGGAVVTPFHHRFTYTTADERWVNADTNHDGKDPSAGDITGKLASRLVALNTCRLSNGHGNRWIVKSVRGDRPRPFLYHVGYQGKWGPVGSGTVAADHSTVLTTPTGGFLAVRYYDGYGAILWTSARSNPSPLCP
jgi:hypothetical protein